MSTDDIYEVQARAVVRGDWRLLCAAYSALGVSRQYAFQPVSELERERGREVCALELKRSPRAPG